MHSDFPSIGVTPYLGELPSFRNQRAVVYNEFLTTFGGGERSCFAYALALLDLGFEVTIATHGDIPSLDAIQRIFDLNLAGVQFEMIDKDQTVSEFYASAAISVFVNHSYMSFDVNPGDIGIYNVMFPHSLVTHLTHPNRAKALSSYRCIAANSTFTEKYARLRWEADSRKFCTLHPPLGNAFIAHADRIFNAAGSPKKDKLILNVGRFNPAVHNKNQLLLIEQFCDARKRFQSLHDWKFLLLGNVNRDRASLEYLQRCNQAAEGAGGAVEIQTDVSFQYLNAAQSRARVYLHGAGAFDLSDERPETCEHFGLSIVEAMALGCIPVVFARGGVFDFLKPGESGLTYTSPDELCERLELLSALDDTKLATFQRRVAGAVLPLSQERFTRQVLTLIQGHHP